MRYNTYYIHCKSKFCPFDTSHILSQFIFWRRTKIFSAPSTAAGPLSKQNFGSRFIIRHNAQKCPYCFTLTIKDIKRRSFALQSLCALLTRIIGSLRKKRSDPICYFYIIEAMASRNSMLLTDFLFASDDSA